MKIIAKTEKGVLIAAGIDEVKEILLAVTGGKQGEIEINQKIPAIDYAGTIRKMKSLQNEYYYSELKRNVKGFVAEFDSLAKAVENAAKIEV